MSIEAIAPLASQAVSTTVLGHTIATQPGMFDSLVNSLADVNGQLLASQQAVRQLAAGETDNLHQVVIQIERARLAFDLVLQVRNKVLEAYQEVMRTQL